MRDMGERSPLQEAAARFPRTPGVYLMKDRAGQVIYVGKAKDLRKRVAAYFGREPEQRYQVRFLMERVAAIDCVVTDTEKEAFLLESTFIKKHQPRYNIHLKDDKSYVSVKLSVRDEFPRCYVTRRIVKDGSLYFGPYASAYACRQVIDFIERHFRLRTCSDHELHNRSRPCLQYQIGRCEAPCVGRIDRDRYAGLVEQVKLFLQGRNHELSDLLQRQMAEEAEQEAFERAARTRDLLAAIDETFEKQKVMRHRWIDQDCLGLYREGPQLAISVVHIREGKVWETRLFHLRSLDEDDEALTSFLLQFYAEEAFIPDELLLPHFSTAAAVLGELFGERRGKKVVVAVPERGDKFELVELAMKNAREGFRRREQQHEETEAVLEELQAALHLVNRPEVIECFDISNLQGRQAVGSLVCFAGGQPDKTRYKRFKIRGGDEPNDFAMMKEVLSRRFARGPKEGEARDLKWALPDLIVVDGGKGQLAMALEAMRELDVTGVDVVGLAKPHEGETQDKAFLPGRKNPVKLRRHGGPLHLLMRVRDEAHRFALAYHRKLRRKALVSQ